MVYYNSDNYAKTIYSIEIPDRCNNSFFDRDERKSHYYEGGATILIQGGNCFYLGCGSLSEWFDFAYAHYPLIGERNLFQETVINGIPAMYRKHTFGDKTFQQAVLYSKTTGGYLIMCEYETSQKEYYDKEMCKTIFSFKEK